MKYTIRNAKKEDCPRILDLIKELAIYEKAPNEVTVSLELMIECGFSENPIWFAFVLEFENEIVGLSLCYNRYSTWKGKRLYLEDLIVTEKYRGYGFGKHLLDHTIAFGKENNYSGMMWQVLDWNQSAIDFYRKYETKFDDEWINVSIDY